MSDGSNASQKILLEPMKNIGAQDILQVGSTYEGVLRKKGGRLGNILSSLKWKRRFVVISQGCMYCFKDEYSSRPQSAFSLSVYESVNETVLPNMLHCFEIKHEDSHCPPQCFAAETDAKRKTWLGYIQDAITQTHLHSGGSPSGSDEGISMTTRRKRVAAPLPALPTIPSKAGNVNYKHSSRSEYSLESDDEEAYDDINEQEPAKPSRLSHVGVHQAGYSPVDPARKVNIPGAVSVFPTNISPIGDNRMSVSHRPKMELPLTPDQQQQQKQQQRASVSSPSGLPDYVNDGVFKAEEYMYNSKDREAAQGLLRSMPNGTFLIRLGNSTPTVLSVKTDIGVKEFQIAEDGSKVSIDKKTYFPNTATMLCFYNQNDLPKSEYKVKLQKGYKT